MSAVRDSNALTFASGLALAVLLLFVPAALSCPCGSNCRCGPSCACAPSPASGPPSSLQVRKNQNSLTDEEKTDFVNAVRALKNITRPGESLNVYDTFVQQHGESFAIRQAHEGPAFLPWHRKFLLDFERELQRVNPNVTIPYWDFARDTTAASWPFTPNFLGGNGDPARGGIVTDGPFQAGQWVLQKDFDGPDLRRTFGVNVLTLPTPEQVAAALGVPQYDAFPWNADSPIDESFRNHLEGFSHSSGEAELHNRVHVWLGGSSAIIYSPNDPIFWMLHANIDRIWAEWQVVFGPQYLPTGEGPRGHNLDDPMFPFGTTPRQMLDHHALGYRYDTELSVIPEPASWVLLTLGVAILWGARRPLLALRTPASRALSASKGGPCSHWGLI